MGVDEKKEETTPVKPVRFFLVHCKVEDLDGKISDTFTDVAPGDNEQDAQDYVVGWLAERGYVVKQWYSIGDVENIKRAVEITSGRAQKK